MPLMKILNRHSFNKTREILLILKNHRYHKKHNRIFNSYWWRPLLSIFFMSMIELHVIISCIVDIHLMMMHLYLCIIVVLTIAITTKFGLPILTYYELMSSPSRGMLQSPYPPSIIVMILDLYIIVIVDDTKHHSKLQPSFFL